MGIAALNPSDVLVTDWLPWQMAALWAGSFRPWRTWRVASRTPPAIGFVSSTVTLLGFLVLSTTRGCRFVGLDPPSGGPTAKTPGSGVLLTVPTLAAPGS